VDEIIGPGRIVSLAQTLLKLTAPGVPDTYQGTELWSLTLVDPDNRRLVDYGLRRRLLEEIREASPEQVMARMDEGVPKLWLIHRALTAVPPPAREGDYQPIDATGAHASRVLAFTRGGALLTVVPRCTRALRNDWGNTALPLPGGTSWRNVFSGEAHTGEEPIAKLFARFPVALLVRT
jgi:(1->4)-alpha-D-glucan 1-alpha-D-glucosylmutase